MLATVNKVLDLIQREIVIEDREEEAIARALVLDVAKLAIVRSTMMPKEVADRSVGRAAELLDAPIPDVDIFSKKN